MFPTIRKEGTEILFNIFLAAHTVILVFNILDHKYNAFG